MKHIRVQVSILYILNTVTYNTTVVNLRGQRYSISGAKISIQFLNILIIYWL